MLRTGEARRIPKGHLEAIARVALRIRPDEPALDPWFDRYCAEHVRRLGADLAIITQHVAPGARLLECGAVPLLMTAALSEAGYAVSAVDLAPERFAGAISNLALDVRRCNVETERVPFDDGAFEAVVFNELFEHLRVNPIFTMREVCRVLKPRGLLLLSTPNLRSFRGLRNLLARDRGHAASPGGYSQYEKLETVGHMGHVREYTATEVAEFLTRVGLRPGTILYRGGHGTGPVGLAERLFPAWRPFFTVIASKSESGHVP